MIGIRMLLLLETEKEWTKYGMRTNREKESHQQFLVWGFVFGHSNEAALQNHPVFG